MRLLNTLLIIAVLSFLISCSGGKQITASIDSGKASYQSGDYNSALADFEEVITWYEKNDNSKECPVYANAGFAAKELNLTEKAIEYFKKDQYSNFVTADTYFELAGLYRQIDNLSKELDELETYANQYPDGNKISQVNNRLFDIYVETENYDNALSSWNMLNEAALSDINNIEKYFTVNQALDNDSVCDQLANTLIKADENNLMALEYLGKKYFWKAENLYHAELKAYEKNKTNKQYKKLLKALDVVSSDFKTSLNYFKKLYKAEPDPGTAKYIGNIYNRLDDKKKADYWYKLAE